MNADSHIARGVKALALFAAAALLGCGHETVADKSARAFAEAQRRGESFAGQGHEHGGHEASGPSEHTHAGPGGAEDGPGKMAGHEESVAAGDHMAHADTEDAGGAHQGHTPATAGHAADQHAAMAMHEHGGTAAPSAHEGHKTGAMTQHAGGMTHATGAMTHDTGEMAHNMGAMTHDMGAMVHGAPAPPPAPPPPAALTAPPGAAAAALSPDPVDAPAPTSIADARRAAEAGVEMGGMAGMHGASGYRQQDPGRAPRSAPPQPTPPAHSHATPPPPGGEGTDE